MNKFIKLNHYPTTMEAELHANILREAGIAAIVQGPQAGIFGAGFSGWSVQGVTLLVSADDYEDALDLIGEEE